MRKKRVISGFEEVFSKSAGVAKAALVWRLCSLVALKLSLRTTSNRRFNASGCPVKQRRVLRRQLPRDPRILHKKAKKRGTDRRTDSHFPAPARHINSSLRSSFRSGNKYGRCARCAALRDPGTERGTRKSPFLSFFPFFPRDSIY